MRRVYLLSLYKNFRARVPLKVLLLTIILSLSTKMISYKIIISTILNMKVKETFVYVINTIIAAPFVKVAVLALIMFLIYSTVKDLVKGTGEQGNKGTRVGLLHRY